MWSVAQGCKSQYDSGGVHPEQRTHQVNGEQKLLVVLSSFGLRIRAQVTRVVAKARSLLYESVRPLPLVAGFFKDLTRSRGQLIAENALLRQQRIVASRKVKRPVFMFKAQPQPGWDGTVKRIARGESKLFL